MEEERKEWMEEEKKKEEEIRRKEEREKVMTRIKPGSLHNVLLKIKHSSHTVTTYNA